MKIISSRRLKILGLGLLLVLGIAMIWLAIANGRANSRLEKGLAELRAAAQPLSLAELAREPIPPETNAATYLLRAKEAIEAIQKEVNAADDASSKPDQQAFGRGQPRQATLKAIRSAFDAFPNCWPLVEKASQCPDYDLHLDYGVDSQAFMGTLLDSFSLSRAAIRVLNYRVMLLLAEQKNEEALETCLAMFRLSRHFDRNPMIVNCLVAMAVRGVAIEATQNVLRGRPLSKTSYEALEAELAQHDLVSLYQQSLRTERAFGVQRFQELIASASGFGWLVQFSDGECDYLDLIDAAIANAGRPYAEARQTVDAMATNVGVLTQLVAPALQAHWEATTRIRAQLRCLRVLNAIYQRDPTGNVDSAINELGLAATVTTDPYNDQPLHIKKLPTGWLVYSVGKNQQDDGGKLNDILDVGLAPIAEGEETRP